jgi:hypothetical protein
MRATPDDDELSQTAPYVEESAGGAARRPSFVKLREGFLRKAKRVDGFARSGRRAE